MNRRAHRDFERTAAAADKARKAKTLDTKGITDPMWEALQTIHLARLTRERGHRASAHSTVLVALFNRGLATWTHAADGNGMVWTTTPEGAAMMKEGRP